MIVGISGKIGTGKSTVARYLHEHLFHAGYPVLRQPFAGLLKSEVAEKFGFPRAFCDTTEGKDIVIEHALLPRPMRVREILQWYGTDVIRAEEPDYWVMAMDKLLEPVSSRTVIIIDDVRFPNEADFVRRQGGLLVRLRPYNGWEPGPYANHESETILDGYDAWDRVYCPEYGGLDATARSIFEIVKRRLEP